MSTTLGSYEIARSGLFVSERGLYVTGHNISNVNTPGYVRQQAMIKNGPVDNTYTISGLKQIGLGAAIQETRQIRHTFLDNIYRQENTTLGYWDTRQKTLQDVQAVIGEPLESGLQNVLNQFWDSWQELSKEPDSLTVRALVRQRGQALVDQINHMGTQFDNLQNNLNNELGVRVNDLNQITSQIAKLNVTISRCEITGDSANDYRDQRNLLLDKLSNMANVVINEMQDGQVDVTLGGYFLVQKGESTDLYAAEKNPGDLFNVVKLQGTNIEVPIKSGTLKGLLESRGEVNGAPGSYANGTPDTKADVVFYVDSSVSTATVTSAIAKYKQDLADRGIDCNVTVSAATIASPADFEAAVAATTTLRPDANKYAILITNGTLSAANMTLLQTALTNNGMEASVITDTPGNASTPGDWASLTSALDGSTYSYTDFSTAATSDALATSIAADTNSDVNNNISMVQDSLNIIPDMRKRLNALVNVMMREINYLQRTGTPLGSSTPTGEDFFVVKNTGRPLELGNIQMNPDFSDLDLIAASKNGANGDNSNALEIANLRNKSFISDLSGVQTLDGYYQSIVLHMANTAAEADRLSQSQSTLVQSADGSRTAISGVSMDEEMTSMMKFKFAYDAATRVLNILDTMTDTIVNKLGLVGR